MLRLLLLLLLRVKLRLLWRQLPLLLLQRLFELHLN
jgi:hypothetical protein